MDTRSIKGILNIENAYRSSRSTKDIYSFIEPNQAMKVDNRYNQHLPNIDGINYENIPDGQVWVFDKDLTKVSEFTSRQEAAKQYGVSATTVMRNMNRVFTKCLFEGAVLTLLFHVI